MSFNSGKIKKHIRDLQDFLSTLQEKMSENVDKYLDPESKQKLESLDVLQEKLEQSGNSDFNSQLERMRKQIVADDPQSSLEVLGHFWESSLDAVSQHLRGKLEPFDTSLQYLGEKFPLVFEDLSEFITAKLNPSPGMNPVVEELISPRGLVEQLSILNQKSEEVAAALKSNISDFIESIELDVFEFDFLGDIPVVTIGLLGIELIDQTLMYYKNEITAEQWKDNIVQGALKYGVSGVSLAVVVLLLIFLFPPLGVFLAGVPAVAFESIAGGVVAQRIVRLWLKHKDWTYHHVVTVGKLTESPSEEEC